MKHAKEKREFVFERSSVIKTSIDGLFNFHIDTNNINLISPGYLNAEIISMSDTPLKKDSVVSLKAGAGPVKFLWTLKIEDFNPPNLISDLQINGPFKYWIHYHIFEKLNGAVKITDRILFVPPFGAIGLAALPLIKLQLNSMFKFRHKKTKEIFEKT